MAQKSWPSGAPARAAAACIAEMPGHDRERDPAPSRRRPSAVEQLEHQRRHGIDAGIAGARPARRARPSAASRARRARAPPPRRARSACRRLAWPTRRAEQVEIERDSRPQSLGLSSSAARLGRAPVGGRRGRCRRSRGGRAARPTRRVERCGGRAMAQVARSPCVLATTSSPAGPAAASAAPSATPWQPISRNTSRGWIGKARLPRPRAPRRRRSAPARRARRRAPWTAGSSALRSIETTQATASPARPASAGRHVRGRSARPTPPALAAEPSARTCG